MISEEACPYATTSWLPSRQPARTSITTTSPILTGIDHLPCSLKVLVENLVRNIDGANITDEHVKTLLDWDPNAEPSHEIQFTPSRVIMQDFTGVPCIVDLATMRDAVKDLGGDPEVINPQVQSDMVIDHSRADRQVRHRRRGPAEHGHRIPAQR